MWQSSCKDYRNTMPEPRCSQEVKIILGRILILNLTQTWLTSPDAANIGDNQHLSESACLESGKWWGGWRRQRSHSERCSAVWNVIPVTLRWNGIISGKEDDRWPLLLSREKTWSCESVPELPSGNISKHHHLLITAYEEFHFNLTVHLWSISVHVYPLKPKWFICAGALWTTDRSSFKYIWLDLY